LIHNLELPAMKPSYRKARTAINEMVGDMSIDRETALRKLQQVIDYATELRDTLTAEDGPDTIEFRRSA